MNRKWLVPLMAAVAAGGVAYAVTRHSACGRAAPSVDQLQDVSFLSRELGLDDAQAGKIKELHVILGAKLNDGCARHCAARARLGQALTADTNGGAQADIVLKEMCGAYEQGERATLDHIRAVRAVLNAEQRRRFDTMISDCMCKPCSMQGGTCGSDVEGAAARDTLEKQKGKEGL